MLPQLVLLFSLLIYLLLQGLLFLKIQQMNQVPTGQKLESVRNGGGVMVNISHLPKHHCPLTNHPPLPCFISQIDKGK